MKVKLFLMCLIFTKISTEDNLNDNQTYRKDSITTGKEKPKTQITAPSGSKMIKNKKYNDSNINSRFNNNNLDPENTNSIITETTKFSESRDSKSTTTTEFSESFSQSTTISTPSTSPCVPGPVENLEANANETEIILSWKPPKDTCEELQYEVAMDNGKKVTIELTTYTFDNLEACTKYKFTVTPISKGERGKATSTENATLVPEKINLVEDLKFNETGNFLTATWGPPRGQAACIKQYSVNVWDDNNAPHSYYTDKTFHNFSSLVGCMQYFIQVKAISIEGKESNLKMEIHTVKAIVTNPPTIIGNPNPNETSAELNWRTDGKEINRCEILKFSVTCTALETENENKEWIISESTVTVDKPSKPAILTTINNLSEFTNYTCYGYVINTAGSSDESEPVKFQTAEGIPSEPRNLLVEEISENLKIIWDEPYKVPGILQHYNILIKNATPNHYIPDGCPKYEDEYYFETNDRELQFSSFQSDFKYTVFVNASTRIGHGDSSETTVLTEPNVPEQLRNLSYWLDQVPGVNYTVSAIITWLLPCNTNGPMSHFIVTTTEVESQTENTDRVDVNEDITNTNYSIKIEILKAAHYYEVSVKAVLKNELEGNLENITFTSPDGFPGPPEIIDFSDVTNSSFHILWKEPDIKNGKLLNYKLLIEPNGPLYEVPNSEECIKDYSNHSTETEGNVTNFFFNAAIPKHSYSVVIQANTSAGYGQASDPKTVNTTDAEPEVIRQPNITETFNETEQYDSHIELSFLAPCHTYGNLKDYKIKAIGKRLNYEDHIKEETITDTFWKLTVKPQYNYTIEVVTNTEHFSSNVTTISRTSYPGLPKISSKEINNPTEKGTTQAVFFFTDDIFDAENGDILYYALIISPNDFQENSTYGFWHGTNETWPDIKQTSMVAYQLTPNMWNPFKDATDIKNITIEIGCEKCSSHTVYNPPLTHDTKYAFKIRGFTSRGYRDSLTLYFTTEALASSKLAMILGIIFGMITATVLSYFIFIIWKKKQNRIQEKPHAFVSDLPLAVPIKEFLHYYQDIKKNDSKLKANYTLLQTKSTEITLPMYTAMLPENKKKNRYSNILPYDATRVKLMPNDDYINASYIQGYSGKNEYIATQGPLESTCLDFWKMVIQENVSIIAMLAQFVEQNKNKCYKYFPNNHENMEIGDGIEIRCVTELNFGNYCIRTFLVQQDSKQLSITHMQFTDWPDFGCPEGTISMLQFCHNLRNRADKDKEMIIVHCSAGVGRTGTLIALDILLQGIKHTKDINIFTTVFNLRKQRINMVQTEKQYMYIHTCIKDAIENPIIDEFESKGQPIYQNVGDISSLV